MERLECRVQRGDETIELWLDWDNVAIGTLRTTGPNGTSRRPVTAERYKRRIIVNPAGSPDPEARIAIVDTHDRMLRIGEDVPWVAYEVATPAR